MVWAAAFRAYMSEIAGGGSRFEWYGTFVAILLAGAITGALLGLAEYSRRTGGRRHWRWLALAPLAFAILPLTMPDAILALFTMGLGGGAVAVPLTGMAGGFAASGRGPIWARLVCGVLALAVVAGIVATVPAVGGIRLGLDQPRGAWVAILGAGCVVVLCLACSIPFRRVESASDASTERDAVEVPSPMRDEI
ncbi:hypothetical protein BCL57_001094 [Agromyces flavus]|uniref:Major facilitator superfamily (MFS) profile domain-containing protein n=1 Tax=Agromyces flavus TaxID=589382 RepID=A0ABT1KJ73_9MICO|nr:hypothetical protein [Agromyces flavus]MCP2366940.1 hypothetical protein [Agromyces flavus]GGI46722.1 hypothetical protein GCM10010932_16040 [Agromyces flavus]